MSTFHLFAYGTLRKQALGPTRLRGCEHVGTGRVHGTLYDIDGEFPALMLYGETPVTGDVWRCPAAELPRLDEYEGTAKGLFRRVAVAVADAAEPGREVPCWCYVAGPALSRRLTPDRRITAWPPPAPRS
jgi:gamma-glutamylcyclotransferase (GGCT)/AIG2-like uncharacterized protein YtfP